MARFEGLREDWGEVVFGYIGVVEVLPLQAEHPRYVDALSEASHILKLEAS